MLAKMHNILFDFCVVVACIFLPFASVSLVDLYECFFCRFGRLVFFVHSTCFVRSTCLLLCAPLFRLACFCALVFVRLTVSFLALWVPVFDCCHCCCRLFLSCSAVSVIAYYIPLFNVLSGLTHCNLTHSSPPRHLTTSPPDCATYLSPHLLASSPPHLLASVDLPLCVALVTSPARLLTTSSPRLC